MSTIASPRPSFTSLTTPSSSRRPSLDHSQAPSPSLGSIPPRRNRAALREYYRLKNAKARSEHSARCYDGVVQKSELDAEGFDAEGYVRGVLVRGGLEDMLKLEAALINEIKGLDGERKALVYDNYSKLITATDTIRKMRTNMDPLTPATSTLSPAISHIAETAASLSISLQPPGKKAERGDVSQNVGDPVLRRKQQRETVRWVLGAPQRLRSMLDAGQQAGAADEWREVEPLLGRWDGVGGAKDIRDECTKIMNAASLKDGV